VAGRVCQLKPSVLVMTAVELEVLLACDHGETTMKRPSP
jgi:hypothetical protein